MTASEAFNEMACRGISVITALDTWLASVEQVKAKKKFTKADMEIISATGRTPLDAVANLVTRLELRAEPQELFEEWIG